MKYVSMVAAMLCLIATTPHAAACTVETLQSAGTFSGNWKVRSHTGPMKFQFIGGNRVKVWTSSQGSTRLEGPLTFAYKVRGSTISFSSKYSDWKLRLSSSCSLGGTQKRRDGKFTARLSLAASS